MASDTVGRSSRSRRTIFKLAMIALFILTLVFVTLSLAPTPRPRGFATLTSSNAPGNSSSLIETSGNATGTRTAAATAAAYMDSIQDTFARAASALRSYGPAALAGDPYAHTKSHPRVIVSMTTIPDRIFLLRETIESLLKQTVKPDEIVLNIPYHSRRFKGVDDAPLEYVIPSFLTSANVTLHRIQRDSGPGTKFIPTIRRELDEGRWDSFIAIADDDVIYPPTWLETFLTQYHSDPQLHGAALGMRGYCLPPANVWEWRTISKIARVGIEITEKAPADVLTANHGILIRPYYFVKKGPEIPEDAPESAYYMDDIWLNGVLAINGVKKFVIPSGVDPKHRKAVQKATNTLENVPSGRAYHNNILLAHFEDHWTNCPMPEGVTISRYFMEYTAPSKKHLNSVADKRPFGSVADGGAVPASAAGSTTSMRVTSVVSDAAAAAATDAAAAAAAKNSASSSSAADTASSGGALSKDDWDAISAEMDRTRAVSAARRSPSSKGKAAGTRGSAYPGLASAATPTATTKAPQAQAAGSAVGGVEGARRKAQGDAFYSALREAARASAAESKASDSSSGPSDPDAVLKRLLARLAEPSSQPSAAAAAAATVDSAGVSSIFAERARLRAAAADKLAAEKGAEQRKKDGGEPSKAPASWSAAARAYATHSKDSTAAAVATAQAEGKVYTAAGSSSPSSAGESSSGSSSGVYVYPRRRVTKHIDIASLQRQFDGTDRPPTDEEITARLQAEHEAAVRRDEEEEAKVRAAREASAAEARLRNEKIRRMLQEGIDDDAAPAPAPAPATPPADVKSNTPDKGTADSVVQLDEVIAALKKLKAGNTAS